MGKTKAFRVLSKYPNHSFTESGELWCRKPLHRIPTIKIDGVNHLAFTDNGVHYLFNELEFFMQNYFGSPLLDYPIIFRDGDETNLSSTNLYYDIPFSSTVSLESPYTITAKLGNQLFKRIPDFPDYFISEYGLVYSVWWRKIMNVFPDKDGYYFIRLACGQSEKKMLRIHRLVYSTFIGKIEDGYVIDHYDADIINNHVSNLSMLSVADNNLKGHTHDMRLSYISDEGVHLICDAISRGIPMEDLWQKLDIRKEFNSLESLTNFAVGLCKGLYYREISTQYDLRNFRFKADKVRKYYKSQIEDVCKMLEMGYSRKHVSETLNIPVNVIKAIHTGYIWKEVSRKYKL